MFVEVDKIQFAYEKSRKVLSEISFTLNKGQTLGIVGASGCGKSTLLRLISGILPLNQSQSLDGKILINGSSPDSYRKLGKLSFMFQEPALMPNLSIKQNIELPLKVKGPYKTGIINALLETVGLQNFSNYLPKQLSGGMKTRVALARSFVTNPELILLDEPFTALDIAWKEELYKELDFLKNEHKATIIFVTHDIEEAIRLAGNNIIVLGRNGKIIFQTGKTDITGLAIKIKTSIINDHSLPLEILK